MEQLACRSIDSLTHVLIRRCAIRVQVVLPADCGEFPHENPLRRKFLQRNVRDQFRRVAQAGEFSGADGGEQRRAECGFLGADGQAKRHLEGGGENLREERVPSDAVAGADELAPGLHAAAEHVRVVQPALLGDAFEDRAGEMARREIRRAHAVPRGAALRVEPRAGEERLAAQPVRARRDRRRQAVIFS